MSDRGRQHVVVAFEIVAFAGEAAKRACDIGCDGRFLGDDQTFSHVNVPVLQRCVIAPTHIAQTSRTAPSAMKGGR
jgi:hypothetical protein